MSVGDLHIKRGDSNQIRLEYTVKSKHESSVKKATVDFDVHGKDADIQFHAPSGGNTNFDVELEVPENSKLDVHEKVGDLTVENIEGDKDLTLGIGDFESPPATQATASCAPVPELVSHGDGYGETSGWLGKTLKYHGEGKY